MPSNDPPQNVDEDNRGEVADSQQDFKKRQEHKKCNLPTTPMRSKTAIPRVHVRNMRLKCRKDSKMRTLSLSLSFLPRPARLNVPQVASDEILSGERSSRSPKSLVERNYATLGISYINDRSTAFCRNVYTYSC